jgi:hypothetical protein
MCTSITEYSLYFGNRLFYDVQSLLSHIVFHDFDGGKCRGACPRFAAIT